MSHNITVEGGTSVRLPTAGKYCDRDIVVKATGGSIWDQEIPDDGKTRIFIHLEDGRTSPMLGCCPKGTVAVDWGDGTEPDILIGTSQTAIKYTPTHKYAEPGDYVITLTVDGSMGIKGSSYGTYLLAKDETPPTLVPRQYAYISSIKKIVIGDGVSITSIGLFGTYTLSSLVISCDVNNFASNACAYCYGLTSVTFHGSVLGIHAGAFADCAGVAYYDFSACTKVPNLSDTSAFTNIADDCEIRVPAALYDEWIAATNWASYADHIVAV